MYKRLANFLRGSVLVEVESGEPERLLNRCAAEDVPFWALQWCSPVTLRLHTTRRGLHRLRHIARHSGALVTTLREHGAPRLLGRLRRRYVLLAGLLMAAALLVEGNFTIWEFQVSGNETVPRERILRVLEDCGVTIGSRSLDIDQKQLRSRALLQLPELVWLAVNVRGCVAQVQVVERVTGEEPVQEKVIGNVVARRAGLVTRVEALSGQAMVEPGSTVTEGQLLISGAVELPGGGQRWQHGMGRVWARTWYELTVSVPLTAEETGAKTDSRTRWALDIGKKRINFYGKGCTSGADCDKIVQYKVLTLPWGFRLPLTLVRETITGYELRRVQRPVEEARAEGESLLRWQLAQLLGEEGTLTSSRTEAVEAGDRLLVTLRAECLEQIGREQPLPD